MAKNPPETEKMNQQSFQKEQIERLSEVYRSESLVITGAPRVIRTPDLRIRSPLLYPTELWARSFFKPERKMEAL